MLDKKEIEAEETMINIVLDEFIRKACLPYKIIILYKLDQNGTLNLYSNGPATVMGGNACRWKELKDSIYSRCDYVSDVQMNEIRNMVSNFGII